MEIFKNIATVVGCISACIALLVTIIKPLRQKIIDSFVHNSQQANLQTNMNNLSSKIDLLIEANKKMDDRTKKIEDNFLSCPHKLNFLLYKN